MITVIDYDIGNLAAIVNMFKRIGYECEITSDKEKVMNATRLILPGNGAFDACIRALRQSGLVPILEEKVMQQKTPLLGICVGAQMLGGKSEEGHEEGLGWLDMSVKRFPYSANMKIPHMGWSEVKCQPHCPTFLSQLDNDARFYFVHSFYMEPRNSQDILLMANYGIDFAAAVGRENILGVQFHPEKSHRFGKQLLEQFAIWS
jgi:glutamine amidotransferase